MSIIYRVVCVPTGDSYIGSTNKPTTEQRWKAHISACRCGRHHSRNLQQLWNEYGEHSFKIESLEECSKDIRHHREQFFVDLLKPTLNMVPVAMPHTSELKKRRESIGLTQEQLARELDVCLASIGHWERGITPIPRGVDLALKQLEETKP